MFKHEKLWNRVIAKAEEKDQEVTAMTLKRVIYRQQNRPKKERKPKGERGQGGKAAKKNRRARKH